MEPERTTSLLLNPPAFIDPGRIPKKQAKPTTTPEACPLQPFAVKTQVDRAHCDVTPCSRRRPSSSLPAVLPPDPFSRPALNHSALTQPSESEFTFRKRAIVATGIFSGKDYGRGTACPQHPGAVTGSLTTCRLRCDDACVIDRNPNQCPVKQ